MPEDVHPYYLCSSEAGDRQGYSTLDTAREALLAWVFARRAAGENVIELDNGRWSDSRVTRWIADRDNEIVKLRE